MKRFLFLSNAALVTLLAVGLTAAEPQAPAGGAFPEKILEGMAEFDIAFLIHGDLRGNYGPCG